jgi:hypothetical protein
MLPYPPHPDAPIEATCAATYYADLIPAFAFVFRVKATKTRFTVYASAQDAYTVNATYRLTISDPGEVPLYLPVDETEFLRRCLLVVEDRWREAITQADAGAARPRADRAAEAGYLDVEPYPSGYGKIGDAFREELGRVTRLRERVDQLLLGLLNPDGDAS